MTRTLSLTAALLLCAGAASGHDADNGTIPIQTQVVTTKAPTFDDPKMAYLISPYRIYMTLSCGTNGHITITATGNVKIEHCGSMRHASREFWRVLEQTGLLRPKCGKEKP